MIWAPLSSARFANVCRKLWNSGSTSGRNVRRSERRRRVATRAWWTPSGSVSRRTIGSCGSGGRPRRRWRGGRRPRRSRRTRAREPRPPATVRRAARAHGRTSASDQTHRRRPRATGRRRRRAGQGACRPRFPPRARETWRRGAGRQAPTPRRPRCQRAAFPWSRWTSTRRRSVLRLVCGLSSAVLVYTRTRSPTAAGGRLPFPAKVSSARTRSFEARHLE